MTTTCNQFKDFEKDGIGVKVVNGADLAAAIDENIKANFVETIGNPRYNVAPIPELAKVRVSVSQLVQNATHVNETGCA